MLAAVLFRSDSAAGAGADSGSGAGAVSADGISRRRSRLVCEPKATPSSTPPVTGLDSGRMPKALVSAAANAEL